MVRLVDDEQRVDARVVAKPGDFGADLPVERGAAALDGQAQLPGDGLVQVHDVAGGQGHVQDPPQPRVQRVGDHADDGGLAAAGLARDQADAAHLEQVAETGLQLARGGRGKQCIGVELVAERQGGEAEVRAVHQRGSCSSPASPLPRSRKDSGGVWAWWGSEGSRIERRSALRLTKQLA